MSLPKIAYTFLGLPEHYFGVSYKDTKLVVTKIPTIEAKISKAPSSGVLLVSGTAAPIVNQLLDAKRKLAGINFVEFYNSRFLKEEDAMELPKASVIVVYNIGSEPANNMAYSAKLISSILASYKNSLVILETDKTLNNFQTAYGISITNTLNIPQKEVEAWI